MRWADVPFDDHDLAQLQTSDHSPQWIVKDGRWRDLAYDKFMPTSSYFRKFTVSGYIPRLHDSGLCEVIAFYCPHWAFKIS
ncbi:hypothetical protein SUGI_0598220 [Cryptomeria japonica]|nr:hypothetical protein SUGI_0598220 [Cryptomeria japonica]